MTKPLPFWLCPAAAGRPFPFIPFFVRLAAKGFTHSPDNLAVEFQVLILLPVPEETTI